MWYETVFENPNVAVVLVALFPALVYIARIVRDRRHIPKGFNDRILLVFEKAIEEAYKEMIVGDANSTYKVLHDATLGIAQKKEFVGTTIKETPEDLKSELETWEIDITHVIGKDAIEPVKLTEWLDRVYASVLKYCDSPNWKFAGRYKDKDEEVKRIRDEYPPISPSRKSVLKPTVAAFAIVLTLVAIVVGFQLWEMGPNPPKRNKIVTLNLGEGTTMDFCWIPAEKLSANESKVPEGGFWLGRSEVTQKQWKALEGEFLLKKDGFDYPNLDPEHPLNRASWNDAISFIAKLNKLPGTEKQFRKTVKFRLPQEHEWVYAAKGGTETKYYLGNELSPKQANYDDSGDSELQYRLTPVGNYASAASHPWELWDVIGNVWEWCEADNGSSVGARRIRGGSWYNTPIYCEHEHRFSATFGDNADEYYFGFRVLVEVTDE